MKLKVNLVIPFTFILLFGCRYKENDKLSLLSAKMRLAKTWSMVEGTRDGTEINISNSAQYVDLVISEVTKNYLNIKAGESGNNFQYRFKDNKTSFCNDGWDDYRLRITKLTNTDLWLEGNNIIHVEGGNRSESVKLKYKVKH